MSTRVLKPDTLEMKGFSAPPSDPSVGVQKKELQGMKTDESTTVRPNARTSERTSVRKARRVRIRHAFDIFKDQLRSLHTIQLEAVRSGRKKPRLGEMVQGALDSYLESKKSKMGRDKKRTYGRTNERSNVRTNERI